jgi:hypothetical protein
VKKSRPLLPVEEKPLVLLSEEEEKALPLLSEE